MNPPSVLLDRSFVVALTDIDDTNHAGAVQRYAELIDLYEKGLRLLWIRSDHLSELGGRTPLLAPLQTMHVAGQHRHAAHGITDVDPDVAVTLVLARRLKIAELATFDPKYDLFDLARVG